MKTTKKQRRTTIVLLTITLLGLLFDVTKQLTYAYIVVLAAVSFMTVNNVILANLFKKKRSKQLKRNAYVAFTLECGMLLNLLVQIGRRN